MSRSVAPATLALALLVAGCSGFAGGPAAERPSLTPVPVPTTDAGTGGQYLAPGVTEERLVDPAALQRAHAARLANTSHTYRERVTRRYANGTLRGQYTTVVRRNESAVRYRYVQRETAENPGYRIDSWADGRRIYTARTVDNETTFRTETVPVTARQVPLETADYAASLGRVFGQFSLVVTGTVRRDGRPLYRLATAGHRDVPPLRNASFVGYVTPRGVVTEYRVSYRTRRDGVPVDVTVAVTVDELGNTTVARPAWYDRAVTRTD